MQEKVVKRAAIYARISKADDEVDKSENQVKELKILAASCGYEVAGIYIDDDTSAYRGETYRPQYIKMLTDIKEGMFDVVMATEPQRFTRGSAGELEVLAMLMVKAKVTMHTRAAGEQDPSKMTTLAMMQIMDIIGGLEVATKIERQKARNAADISKGIPTKGLRPFGWEKDRMTIRESEALHVREAVREILEEGSTIWAIAKKWNSLGLKTESMLHPRASVKGTERKTPSGIWTTSTVRQVLKRPRNAGILVSDGIEMPESKIQPIVSREDFEALLIAIKGETSQAGPKPKYLLGGILECPCGERMNASKSNTSRKGKTRHEYRIYRCRVYGVDTTKRHATVQISIADKVVRQEVVADVGLEVKKTAPRSPTAILPIKTKIAKLKEEVDIAIDLIYTRIGDASKHKGRIRKLETEIRVLEAEQLAILASHAQSNALDSFVASLSELENAASFEDVDAEFEKGFAAWDALPIEDRRNIIKAGYRVQLESGGRGEERVHVMKLETSS